MYRLSTVIVLTAFITTSAMAKERATRAEEVLARQWKQLAAAPKSTDAEIKLLSIFKLWDDLGPAPIMRALKRAISLPGASIRVRERARHLLSQGNLRLGRLDLAEASYAARGFLSKWVVVGPFDNEGGTGFDTAFPPEENLRGAVDPKTPMPGKDSEIFLRTAPAQISHMGFNHLEALYEPDINICAYALSTIQAERAGKAILWIGAGGAFRAFWNGREAIRDSIYRRPDPDRFAATVKVKKGMNRLIVKVCAEGGGDLGFYARVTDRLAKPWPLIPAADQKKMLAALVPTGRPPTTLPQPVTLLVSRAKKKKDTASVLATAARYLRDTGAVDSSSHLSRDLARAACNLEQKAANCLLWASLALDLNEHRLALNRALDNEPNSVPALLALARLEKEEADFYRALPLVEAALTERPCDLEAQALKIDIMASRDFPQSAFAAACKLAEKHRDIPRIIELAEKLAALSDRAADGLRLTEEGLKFRFTDQAKHEVLARAAFARGDLEAFEHHLNALERLAPFDEQVLAFTAELFEGSGNIDRAERAIRTRTELARLDASAWKELGLFLTRQNRFEHGLRALYRAAAISPQDTWLADYLAYLDPEPAFWERFIVSPETFLAKRGHGDASETARYLLEQTVVRVFDSGLSSRFEQFAVEIKSRKAARDWRQYWINFAPASQRIKVLAARVFRPDGSEEKSVYRDTVPVSEPWYRLYYDIEAELIELPPLFPGDVVELRYRVDDTAHRNVFNDYFGDFVFIEDDTPKDLWRYVLISPTSRNFYFNKRANKRLSRSRKKKGNLNFDIFEAQNVPSIKREHAMAGLTAAASYLHVSTYGSWEDLGEWYRGLIRHQLIPDARIRSKVRELTEGLKDDRKKVDAIYEWVVTATRYVGLEFGIHGYKPYRAPLVVSRGFGDCKDKASLLVSMLREAGIDAEFVLVRTRDQGDIEKYPASLAVFNHAIVHLPSVDLWLDGTAEHHGTLEFPFPDQDAPALRLSPNRARFVHTPIMPPERNRSTSTLDILLDPDGDAQFEVRSSINGPKAAAIRQELEAERTRRERFEASLAMTFPGARLGELDFTSITELTKPVEYRYTAFVPEFAKTVSNTIEIPIDIGLELIALYGRLPDRKHDLIVGSTKMFSRDVTIHIPSSHEIALLPSVAMIESRFGKLSFEVYKEAETIRTSRRFKLLVHRVSIDDYPDFVEFCRQVDDVLQGRIVLRRTK